MWHVMSHALLLISRCLARRVECSSRAAPVGPAARVAGPFSGETTIISHLRRRHLKIDVCRRRRTEPALHRLPRPHLPTRVVRRRPGRTDAKNIGACRHRRKYRAHTGDRIRLSVSGPATFWHAVLVVGRSANAPEAGTPSRFFPDDTASFSIADRAEYTGRCDCFFFFLQSFFFPNISSAQ